jgi:putative aldouronate transport system substrate-binding protein
MDRRRFLRILALGGAGLPLLVACGPAAVPAAPTPSTGGALASAATAVPNPVTVAPTSAVVAPARPAKLMLPTFVPLQGVAPDLQPSEAGQQAAFFAYPKNLVKSIPQPPGKGGDVTAFTQTAGTVAPPVDQNAAWQAVNKALNANMKVELVPASDYQTKTATLMAGNDYPDLFQFQVNLTIGNIPQFLKANYADLTPFLGGDAIKAYPNLAAFPTSAWTQMVYDGAIYGVPILRPCLNFVNFVNQNMLEAIGAQQPKNGDDFKQLLRAFTRPDSSVYGLSAPAPAYGLQWVGKGDAPSLSWFRAPNNWSVDASGKLLKDLETEQFKAGLAFIRDLYAAGYYYPDTPNLNTTTLRSNLVGGKYAVAPTGWAAFAPFMWDVGLKSNPIVRFRALRPFSIDGSAPIWNQFSGVNGLTAVKKGSPERVQELLSILNYLAAPFGTEEFHLVNYGVKDVDHAFDDKGNPILTDKGKAELAISSAWQYLAAPMPVLFDPNDAEFARAAYADEQAFVPVLQTDATLGLYSATDNSKGGPLTQRFSDGLGDIVAGRTPLSGLDQLIADWRSNGGDQMRTEYQQAYAAAKQ